MFIVTSKLINYLTNGRPYRHLGPWSVSDNEDIVEVLNSKILDNPWDNRKKFEEASVYTYRVYENTLEEIAAYLNKIFELQFGIRYWRILIGFWLWHFVNIIYDRYILLKKAQKAFPDFSSAVLNEKCFISPYDMNDYINLSANKNCEFYNLQLFSFILNELEQRCEIIDIGYKRNCKKISLARKIKELSASCLSDLTRRKRNFIIHGHISPESIIKILFFSKQKVGYLRKEFNSNLRFEANYESDKRKGFKTLPSSNEFERILVRSLGTNFPTAYLEGFPIFREIVSKGLRDHVPSMFCSVGGVSFSEFGKFYVAELSERGTKIINVQHGGNYGINRHHQYERYEISISDRYWCWGWADSETNSKLANVPSMKLSNLRRYNQGKRKSGGDNILFVGTSHPQYLYRFWNFPVSTQWVSYLKKQIQFISEIGDALASNILYRPHHIEYGWDFTKRIKQYFPELRIDDLKHSFKRQVRDAGLVVIDHNATSFLETLSANIPTIIFFDLKFFEIRDSAIEYFECLKSSGIYFESPKQAARHIQKIYPDIDKWWYSNNVQDMRRSFVGKYALTKTDPERMFIESMEKEVSASDDNRCLH